MESPPKHRSLSVLVFAVGMASLGAEIATARLLAPYFGASTIVWANTIGVVLVSLSIGYGLGGRFADRHPHEHGLRILVLVAALLLAAVPFLSGPLLPLSASAFESLNAGAFAGSLAGVTLLVAVPILLLGAVSPWAVRLAVPSVELAGSTAGRLFAISTAGSLVGTFLSALVLVPFVGTQRTFLIFAAVMAVVAASRLPWRAWPVAALPLLLMLLPAGVTKPARDEGVRLLHERETQYQYVRVLERPGGRRTLELNEGQATHSVYEPDTVLTGGVWDGYLVLPRAGLPRVPRSMAMLGNAAGTAARAYARYFPETWIDGVELDPELSEVGRRFFGMKNPRLRLYEEDARPFLRRIDRRYDVIAVDAYRQPYIPFYLTTKEFFALAKSRLEPGGVVIVNAGHPEGEDGLEKVLAAGLRSSFRYVMRWPKEVNNTLLVASEAPLTAAGFARQAASMPLDLQPLTREAAFALAPALEGGKLYTDDKAPVEWLIDSSIVRYAADG